MRNIDYSLNIINEKKIFKPRPEFIDPIINSNKKIFMVTAGNGYGKTFLLNLIAYALEVDKLGDEYILKSLRESISRYSNPEDYDLSYHLNFELPDKKKLILSKESHKERIVQFEGESPIGFKNLHKYLTVLYDVPTDPHERLNAVIKDLGMWNESLSNKLNNYWSYLRNLQNDFTNVRDENKIKTYKEDIEKFNKLIEIKINEIAGIDTVLKKLKTINSLIKLLNLIRKNDVLNADKIKNENKFKTLKKPTRSNIKDDLLIKSLQRECSNSNNIFRKVILDFITIVSKNPEILELIYNDKKLESSFKYVQENTIDDIIDSDNYVVKIKVFLDKISDLKDSIIRFIQTEQEGKKYIIHNFLTELLKQIDELIKYGADDVLEDITKTKTNFLKEAIGNRIGQYEIKNYDSLTKFLLNDLKLLKPTIDESFKIKIRINKENKKQGVDAKEDEYNKLKGTIDDINLKLKENSKELFSLRHSCSAEIKEDIELLNTSENVNHIIANLKYKIGDNDLFRDLSKTISEKEGVKSTLLKQRDTQIESRNMNLVRLDLELKKNLSQFTEDTKNKINHFIDHFSKMIQNLGKFKGIINSIDQERYEKFKDEEDLEFIKVAGSIIAFSMDNRILRPDGVYTDFIYFDMIKKNFHCADGIKIKKEDISTGLASANYLKQRIDNIEGEYVIILLDESGLMNKGTLNEVIKSIKKLEDQNRLVLALLTKPRDEGILIEEY